MDARKHHDAIRVHLVKRVKRVDADGRFGIYYTEHPGGPDDLFEVHSRSSSWTTPFFVSDLRISPTVPWGWIPNAT